MDYRGFEILVCREVRTGEVLVSVYDCGILSDHPTREAAIQWIDDQFEAAAKLTEQYLS